MLWIDLERQQKHLGLAHYSSYNRNKSRSKAGYEDNWLRQSENWRLHSHIYSHAPDVRTRSTFSITKLWYCPRLTGCINISVSEKKKLWTQMLLGFLFIFFLFRTWCCSGGRYQPSYSKNLTLCVFCWGSNNCYLLSKILFSCCHLIRSPMIKTAPASAKAY